MVLVRGLDEAKRVAGRPLVQAGGAGVGGIEALLGSPLADAVSLQISERATRDALRVITASYEYHGGFRLRTLSA